MINKRKAYAGDPQEINILFNGAKPGEKYYVDVQILKPNGDIESSKFEFEILEDLTKIKK